MGGFCSTRTRPDLLPSLTAAPPHHARLLARGYRHAVSLPHAQVPPRGLLTPQRNAPPLPAHVLGTAPAISHSPCRPLPLGLHDPRRATSHPPAPALRWSTFEGTLGAAAVTAPRGLPPSCRSATFLAEPPTRAAYGLRRRQPHRADLALGASDPVCRPGALPLSPCPAPPRRLPGAGAPQVDGRSPATAFLVDTRASDALLRRRRGAEEAVRRVAAEEGAPLKSPTEETTRGLLPLGEPGTGSAPRPHARALASYKPAEKLKRLICCKRKTLFGG
uniref:Uncharacterized protein n=1 Tax=Setaria viridis TaxID=4556 RepID=A0A4U6W0V5_SETVI|nr:hypothetical protein SEVIR_2G336400v2 [Setaria viridis]